MQKSCDLAIEGKNYVALKCNFVESWVPKEQNLSAFPPFLQKKKKKTPNQNKLGVP